MQHGADGGAVFDRGEGDPVCVFKDVAKAEVGSGVDVRIVTGTVT